MVHFVINHMLSMVFSTSPTHRQLLEADDFVFVHIFGSVHAMKTKTRDF